MSVAGIDFSTRAVDVVLLDEDSDAATWHRFELTGQDAFHRARMVCESVPPSTSELWDAVLAIGIEDPRGYGAGSLYRIQGAILSCLPINRLVHPLIPSHWRKTVGLPGNASKADVWRHFVNSRVLANGVLTPFLSEWPQDGADAYFVALATRSLLRHGEKDVA